MSGADPDNLAAWRVRSLDETWARLSALSGRIGVTRVGSTTRLDASGVCSASAFRSHPLGEGISVYSGKGSNELEAKVAALAEALERYCAEPRGRIAVRLARTSELGECVHPTCLHPAREWVESELLDWCAAQRTVGTDVWVPANAVFFPYMPAQGVETLFAAHTTGLAAGNSLPEAVAVGLLECIERDARARAVALATAGFAEQVPIVDPGEIENLGIPEWNSLRSAGCRILIRDLYCDTRVPVYLCTLSDGERAHWGCSAHPDPRHALRRALQESLQSRITDFQGAREDLPPDSDATVDEFFLEAGTSPVVDMRAIPARLSVSDLVGNLEARLRALDHGAQPVWVDLSLPESGMRVVRVVAPGLEMWADDPARLGSRAQRWLSGLA